MKQLPAQFGEMKQNFSAVIAEMKQNFTAQIDDLKKENARIDKAAKEMFSLLEKIAENSQEQPIEQPLKWEEMTPLQQFRALKQKQN